MTQHHNGCVALRPSTALPATPAHFFHAYTSNQQGLLQLWLASTPLAARVALGPVYIMASLIAAMLLNLGTRRAGDASAYSLFNAGVRRLPGEMSQAEVDRAARGGWL